MKLIRVEPTESFGRQCVEVWDMEKRKWSAVFTGSTFECVQIAEGVERLIQQCRLHEWLAKMEQKKEETGE